MSAEGARGPGDVDEEGEKNHWLSEKFIKHNHNLLVCIDNIFDIFTYCVLSKHKKSSNI